MPAELDPIDELLASISDGTAVDWEETTRRAPPAQRGRLAALREVSHIASFSRSLQRGGDSGLRGAPECWGDMVLLECIGSGAHADVYRAWDARLQREVALKLVRTGSESEAAWLE